MSTLHCPYCHSEQVIRHTAQASGARHFERILETFSPSVMLGLGVKLAKHAGIPPYIGGLIGVVVGGTLILVSQHYVYHNDASTQNYHCLQCEQDFTVDETS